MQSLVYYANATLCRSSTVCTTLASASILCHCVNFFLNITYFWVDVRYLIGELSTRLIGVALFKSWLGKNYNYVLLPGYDCYVCIYISVFQYHTCVLSNLLCNHIIVPFLRSWRYRWNLLDIVLVLTKQLFTPLNNHFGHSIRFWLIVLYNWSIKLTTFKQFQFQWSNNP